jgi:Tfp pilus assembly protein PilF
LIDAHIFFGRIFLELGDRSQALTYARSAIEIDPNNQEAQALMKQLAGRPIISQAEECRSRGC